MYALSSHTLESAISQNKQRFLQAVFLVQFVSCLLCYISTFVSSCMVGILALCCRLVKGCVSICSCLLVGILHSLLKVCLDILAGTCTASYLSAPGSVSPPFCPFLGGSAAKPYPSRHQLGLTGHHVPCPKWAVKTHRLCRRCSQNQARMIGADERAFALPLSLSGQRIPRYFECQPWCTLQWSLARLQLCLQQFLEFFRRPNQSSLGSAPTHPLLSNPSLARWPCQSFWQPSAGYGKLQRHPKRSSKRV